MSQIFTDGLRGVLDAGRRLEEWVDQLPGLAARGFRRFDDWSDEVLKTRWGKAVGWLAVVVLVGGLGFCLLFPDDCASSTWDEGGRALECEIPEARWRGGGGAISRWGRFRIWFGGESWSVSTYEVVPGGVSFDPGNTGPRRVKIVNGVKIEEGW